MALIACARVSTDEQTTAPQTDVLRRAGCSVIFEEHASGADRERPQLRLAIEPGMPQLSGRLRRRATR
jgi:DNA invertase Pin-like site-specific DNA recombinase